MCHSSKLPPRVSRTVDGICSWCVKPVAGWLADEPCHPGRERLLVGGSGGVGIANVEALGLGAVLADLELALDARDGNAKAYNPGEHRPSKAIRHGAPPVEIHRFVGADQPCEHAFLAGKYLNKVGE